MENQIQQNLSKVDFLKGMDKLQGVFKTINIDIDICYEYLKDIEKRKYFASVDKIIKNEGIIYQGTNIIALIRKYSFSNINKYLE